MDRVGSSFRSEERLALELDEESGAGAAGSAIDEVGQSFGRGCKRLALELDEESGAGAAAVKAPDLTCRLPDELISLILSRLDDKGRARAFVVCRRWACIAFADVNRTLRDIDQKKQKQTLFADIEKFMKMGQQDKAIVGANAIITGVPGRIEYFRSIVQGSLCEELVKQGDIKKASSLANKIRHKCERDKALGPICVQLAATGDVEAALRKANKISISDGVRERYAKVGLYHDCTVRISKPPKRIDVFQLMANELLRVGNLDEAQKVFMWAPKQHVENRHYDTLVTICQKYVEIGSFSQAKEVAKMIPNYIPQKFDAYKRISDELIKQGDIAGAVEVAKSLRSTYVSTFTFERMAIPVFQEVAIALAERRDIIKLKDVVNMMATEKAKNCVWIALCDTFINRKNIALAALFAKMITDQGQKSNRLKQLKEILVKQEADAKIITDQSEKSRAFASIAEGHFANGDFKRARAIAEMIPISDLGAEALRTEMLRCMGNEVLKDGLMIEALEFFNAMPDQLLRMVSIDDALKTIDAMPDGAIKSGVLLNIATRKLDAASSQGARPF